MGRSVCPVVLEVLSDLDGRSVQPVEFNVGQDLDLCSYMACLTCGSTFII